MKPCYLHSGWARMAHYRWILSIVVVAGLVPVPLLRAEDCPTNCADGPSCCCFTPGPIASVDYLHWRASRLGLDFAAVGQPAGTPGDPAFTTLATDSLDLGWNSGVRAGLGYRLTPEWDVAFNFTYFRDTASGSATKAAATTLLATQSFFNQTPRDSIAADASLRLNLYDLEASWHTPLTDTVDFRVFGGLRWARIDEEFHQSYSYHFDPVTTALGTIDLPTDINAEGVRLGAGFERSTAQGWRAFGRGAISYLFGDFRSRARETDTILGPLRNVQQSSSRLFPVLEGAAGIGWCRGPLEVDAGYEISLWANMPEIAGVSQDLTIHGYFLRLVYSR